jgi:hypothetical protein
MQSMNLKSLALKLEHFFTVAFHIWTAEYYFIGGLILVYILFLNAKASKWRFYSAKLGIKNVVGLLAFKFEKIGFEILNSTIND